MAALEKALKEEYQRLQQRLQQIDCELETLPKGYISEKKIHDRTYFYLQRREQKKVVSEYIKKDNVEQMRRILAYRKMLEGERKDVLEEFDRVRKVFGIYTQAELNEKLSIGLAQAKMDDAIPATEFFEEMRRRRGVRK